jgi:hypothetical protein
MPVGACLSSVTIGCICSGIRVVQDDLGELIALRVDAEQQRPDRLAGSAVLGRDVTVEHDPGDQRGRATSNASASVRSATRAISLSYSLLISVSLRGSSWMRSLVFTYR